MTTRRVIKVGTSLLRGDASRSTEQVIADLASSLSGLWQRGEPVALVTSGAVGLGCHALGQAQRPSEVEALQAAAAVGQGRLMTLYDQAFASHGRCVAQVLLTRGDLASRRRYQNACRTLEQLLAWAVTPVINEDDTLATLQALVDGLIEWPWPLGPMSWCCSPTSTASIREIPAAMPTPVPSPR